ncbi:CU044_5270 family protein [Nonomuraea gerenzanensis]|nr:CU044_5270 family protein [Nonomuraea gerenzanensis]UBU08352.1 CU044_5270 family protein [Nonomuraea gerenzanensis]
MMDEFGRFLEATPAITGEAKEAARTRLLQAIREPVPMSPMPPLMTPPRRRRPRLAWRLALAASVALAVGAGVLAVSGDEQPATTPVASVRDLGDKAARSAETDPYEITPSPGRWLYVKQTIAPLRKEPEPEVDRDKRMTLETWHSLDGKQIALDNGRGKLVTEEYGPGVTGADLARAPVTPEEMIARIGASVDATPVTEFDDADATRQERIFRTISQLLGEQPLVADVRAALFRALPMIQGVSVKQDAIDAAGRHGVAFGYTGAWERSEIIVSAQDYRFLGTYGETVADRTFPISKMTVRAGTPTVWTANMESRVVDRPGDRP